MKHLFQTLLLILSTQFVLAQRPSPEVIQGRLPDGTVIHGNLAYIEDNNDKHLLDLYIPKDATAPIPLVVMVHGGGWISNDKYSHMGWMPETMNAVLNNGMAMASIDYRYAQDAVFPGILQDCNAAVAFLYDHADEYGLDMKNVAVVGFSAGGHLASLMGTSQNDKVASLYAGASYRPIEYKAVVDYFGPTNLVLLPGNEDASSPEGVLIGAEPLLRPDLAAAASPITYIDKNDPPFLIYHGEKDNIVSNKQSKLFSAWLDYYGVTNKLTIVKDAPHFGKMYDVEEIRTEVISFLSEHLKQ
jgi:acetyl esterase/lipase